MKFWKKVLAILMIYPIVILSACSFAQVITDIQKYEPIVLNVLNLACVLSPAAALCATGEAVLNASYGPLMTALEDYETALQKGTATVAAYNELNALFATFEGDSSNILALAHVFDPNSQKSALALVASCQTLMAVIEAAFPGPPPAAALSAQAMKPRPRMFAKYLPANATFDQKWLSAWLVSYNKQVAAARKETAGAKLKTVHVHGWEIRLITAGLAK